jgi:hypothetical protein
VVPRNRSIYQVLRFPPQGPVGFRSPASTVLSEHSDAPPSFPPHFVSFAWRYHRAPIVRLSSARSTRLAEAWGFRVRQPLGRSWNPVEMTGPLTFPGDPLVHMPCSATPAGPTRQAMAAIRCCPRVCPERGLPRRVFRGSITRPVHLLSTLRSHGRPSAAQDSLPPAGQALTGGIRTRWIPMKSFSFASYIASSFPELRDARTATNFKSG